MELFAVTLPDGNVLAFQMPAGSNITPELLKQLQKDAVRVRVDDEQSQAGQLCAEQDCGVDKQRRNADLSAMD